MGYGKWRWRWWWRAELECQERILAVIVRKWELRVRGRALGVRREKVEEDFEKRWH